MRVDKYLKISRLIKRRTVAHDACEQDRIYINGKQSKPGAQVKPGDVIKIVFGNSEMTVRVKSCPEHVTKDGAAELYEIVTE
ncbi:MAG: RNA-binding S4 domain-containing protein [Clostridia bacterium]|nr:RNA-binding S4 domain-containing protein [Clostridia bacterium]